SVCLAEVMPSSLGLFRLIARRPSTLVLLRAPSCLRDDQYTPASEGFAQASLLHRNDGARIVIDEDSTIRNMTSKLAKIALLVPICAGLG
ncbi:hypothetical protein ABTD28_19860, partial [Acinetobacter baumannii]